MNKKLIIIMVLIVAGAVAFFAASEHKKEEENSEIAIKAYSKLVSIGKKSARVGFSQMGSALRKYHKKYNLYPEELLELHPEFIPLKKFITDINWNYELRGEDFLLRKTVKKGKRKLTISMDSKFKPKRESGDLLLASGKAGVKKKSVEKKNTEFAMDLKLKQVEIVNSVEQAAVEEPEPESLIEQPEITSIVDGEIAPSIPSSVSKKFLVWRDKSGSLGFGNVIYPNTRELEIHKDGSWVNIKKPVQKGAMSAGKKGVVKTTKGAEVTAPKYSRRYLVWKDRKGNIGYGNVQYPMIEDIEYICVNGTWQKVVN